jgi:lipopolysaccharide transport system ATP-binding protein
VTASDLVVDVAKVSKRFCRGIRRSLRYALQDFTRELVTGERPGLELRPEEFWAVRDVSIQLRRGEALGLIGRNGAGKTTLLRMIAGLIRPDTGEIRTRGRIVPLLALGAGFNPVLSGLENIVVNMSILGVSKSEIRRRLEDVIAFAEIDPTALDAPVRTYSSGMAARLGFACAIHTDPDLLLIDEVLAVGDIAFRTKCYRQLAEMRKRGVTFVMVSHSAHTLVGFCDTGVYLDRGMVKRTGSAAEVMDEYERDLPQQSGSIITAVGTITRPVRPVGSGSGLDIIRVQIEDGGGEPRAVLLTTQPMAIRIRCHCHHDMPDVAFVVAIRDFAGEGGYTLILGSQNTSVRQLASGTSEVRLKLDPCGLRPGTYIVKLYAEQPPLRILDLVEGLSFQVESLVPMRDCLYYQPRDWEVLPAELPANADGGVTAYGVTDKGVGR